MSDFRTQVPASVAHSICRDDCGLSRVLIACLATAMVTATVTGCTSPATNLSGTVTLDGRPVEEATLQFYPAAGDGQTSHAFTDQAGRFFVIVSPVPMVVTISKSLPSGTKVQAFPDTPPENVMAETLAPRYSDLKKTELRVAPVEGKTTVADFALTSGFE